MNILINNIDKQDKIEWDILDLLLLLFTFCNVLFLTSIFLI